MDITCPQIRLKEMNTCSTYASSAATTTRTCKLLLSHYFLCSWQITGTTACDLTSTFIFPTTEAAAGCRWQQSFIYNYILASIYTTTASAKKLQQHYLPFYLQLHPRQSTRSSNSPVGHKSASPCRSLTEADNHWRSTLFGISHRDLPPSIAKTE